MNGAEETGRDFLVMREGTGWPHGDVVIEKLLADYASTPLPLVLERLEAHFKTMGIATRFRGDRFANQIFAPDEVPPPLEAIDILYGHGKNLSEAGHKRARLLLELAAIRQLYENLLSRLASLCLNAEAANMECNGTQVPKPSAAQRLERDTFQPKPPAQLPE